MKAKNIIISSNIGKRENNEDFCFPETGSVPTKVFVVCDGVGGLHAGEVASKLVAIVFGEYFNQFDAAEWDNAFEKALKIAEVKLSEYKQQHLLDGELATTLVAAVFHKDKIWVAHCGDSRFYYFRNGEIIFQTKDHSLVNEWVEQGIISEEEALNHPRKNIITRAISGAHKPTQISSYCFTDICNNDKMFLCTDGVLESISNEKIKQLSLLDNLEMHQYLQQECGQNSQDNFSYILLDLEVTKIERFNTKWKYIILIIIGFLAVLAMRYFLIKMNKIN